MRVLAKLMEVLAIWVRELVPEPEGKEEPKIVIEAVRDWGDWDLSLGEHGHQGYRSNFVELDIDSEIGFEDLEIQRISRINSSLCVYLLYPTDIAVVDTGKLFDVPFEPLEVPLSSIVISGLNNLGMPAHKDS